jgi:hypothetical protein
LSITLLFKAVYLAFLLDTCKQLTMDCRRRADNENTVDRPDPRNGGYDSQRWTTLLHPSPSNEGRRTNGKCDTVVIHPPQSENSRYFVFDKLPEIPLSQIQIVHVHRIGSFVDLRLNLNAFSSLKTLVVHILPDPDIQNTNFGIMTNRQVYEFAITYLFHHRRHRRFRDNLSRLHQNEGRPKNFTLRAHLKGMDSLTFIIVDLDTHDIERGIRCLPPDFFQSPREGSLRNDFVPRIQIPEPCHPSHCDDAWWEISLNWLRTHKPNPADLSGPWRDPEYCRLFRHFQQQRQLEASQHGQLQLAALQTDEDVRQRREVGLEKALRRMQLKRLGHVATPH